MEDLIANEGCIISITHGGFIKRTAVSAFRAQRRGGKGVIGMTTREGATEEEEGDFIEHLFTATTHDYLMFFTAIRARLRGESLRDSGNGPRRQGPLHRQSSRIARRRKNRGHDSGSIEEDPAPARIPWMKPGTRICTSFSRRAPASSRNRTCPITATSAKAASSPSRSKKDDCLIDAKLTNGDNEIVLITKEGMSLRFHEEQLRDQGRNTVGVWGIRPEKGDHVVAIAIVNPDAMLLVAGENGIGKRTPFDDYRRQSRGGKGIITMKTGEKTGNVVGALTVTENDELMLITTKGQMVRTRVKEIRDVGRNTMGVKLMDLRGAEKLQAIAPVVSQESAEVEPASVPPEGA